MSIKGGSIEFDIVANNGQIKGALDETKRRITGFSKATVAAGEDINEMFDATKENIIIQKKVIKDLEAQYKELEAQVKKLSPGQAQAELEKQAAQVKREISAEKEALTQLEVAVKKNETAHTSFRQRLREVREAMAELELQGKADGEEYARLQGELGELSEAMDAVTTQANTLKKGEKGWEGLITAVSGLTGAFGAAQGAISLVAGEDENLQRIMVKIQSLMAISIGLREVQIALDKDEAFNLVILTKAKKMFSAATFTAGKALIKFGVSAGVARVAATALMATLTLGLSVAITAAVVGISKLIDKNREAKKAAEEFNSKVADGAAAQIVAVEALSSSWVALGDNLKAKEQFIVDNKDKFNDLGTAVNSAKDAENLLVKNKDKFVEACIAKAKALATQSLAADKYKEILKKQQEVEAMPETKSVWVQTGSSQWGASGYYATGENTAKKEAQEELKKMKEDADKLVKEALKFSAEEARLLQEAGVKKSGKAEGTPDPKAETATFANELEKRKGLYEKYFKWANSKDEILRNAAKVEFAGLLAQGANYLEYLQKQREQLLAAIGNGKASAKQKEHLQDLNNAIAEETKQTVLGDFEAALKEQLSGAKNVFEMLAILKEKREELKGDGTDLDNGKKEILDNAAAETQQKVEDDTQQLLDEYGGYLAERLEFEASYGEKSRLLNKAIAEAKTEDEKKIAEAALQALKEKRLQVNGGLGQTDYEALTQEYRTYQQKIADITEDYDKKIALAQKNNNKDLVAALQAEKEKALSSTALEQLQSSGAFTQLLGNLDDLTTKQLQDLIKKIEGQKASLGVELKAEDLQVILDKLKAAKDEVESRNPFKALKTALKDYKKDASKANLSEVFSSTASTIDLVKGSFDSVTGALANMGLAGDEVTQQLLGDIGEMLGSAGDLAKGIATGNPLGIIQGSVGLISSAFKVFNIRDRKAERAIKKHAAAVKELESAYKALEYAVNNALGESVYKNQKALISNMREQQEHVKAMWEAEEGKKKTDHGKVQEYKDQYAELGRQIEDTIREISQQITQTNAKDLANQLADAIADTFTDGFNSDKVKGAINDVVNKVMQNAVKNALKLQFIEGPLQGAIEQLQKNMGFDKEGNGTFDGLSEAEQDAFRKRVEQIGKNYAEALKIYEDIFKSVEDTGDPTTSMAGAIKGASQESIDLLAGQTNAVRVNQVVSIDILRQQLLRLANIDEKVGISNGLLRDIYNEVKGYAADPLRAQGIAE